MAIMGGGSSKVDSGSVSREIGAAEDEADRTKELIFNDEAEKNWSNCQRCVSASIKSMMNDENFQSSQFPKRINEGNIERARGAIAEDTGVTFGPDKTVGSGPQARLADGYYTVFTGLAKDQRPGDSATHVMMGASESGVMRFFDPQSDSTKT